MSDLKQAAERALMELADEAAGNGNDAEWINARVSDVSAALAAIPAPAPAQEPVALESDEAIRIWHKHCDPFASKAGPHPSSAVIRAMMEFAARSHPASVAASVPEGWKLVPVEPTQNMLNTWAMQMPQPVFTDQQAKNPVLGWHTVATIWKNMLAAAPGASTVPQGEKQ